MQNLATAVIGQRQNNRRSNPRQRFNLLLDFSEFDALAVNFDLAIVASQVLKLVICAPPNEISRSIERSFAVRVGDEPLPGQSLGDRGIHAKHLRHLYRALP